MICEKEVGTIKTYEMIPELKRLRRTANGTLAGGIITMVAGFLIFLAGAMEGSAIAAGGLLFFVISIVLFVLYGQHKKSLKTFVGEQITVPVLQEFMELESFEPNAYTDKSVLDSLSILPGHNMESGSDLIRGTYKGNRMELCDLLLQQITSTGKTTTVVTVFEGQLVTYALDRVIDGYVEVTKRTVGKADGFFKRLKRWGASVSTGREYEYVETENEAFNRMFDVRAENPQTAFLVLTPQFMERLMTVNGQVSTNFCFAGDRLYMAVKSEEDRFEVNTDIDTETDLEQLRERLRQDMRATTSLLDELRKNDYLF